MSKAHLTAIHRSKPTAPAKLLNDRGLLKGKKLDFGCGKSIDFEVFNMDRFDPHFYPDVTLKEESYDTVVCNYVLNVIESESERNSVINRIRSLLKANGAAYITVRRDIKTEGFTSKGTYQENIKLNLPVIHERKGGFCIYKLTKD